MKITSFDNGLYQANADLCFVELTIKVRIIPVKLLSDVEVALEVQGAFHFSGSFVYRRKGVFRQPQGSRLFLTCGGRMNRGRGFQFSISYPQSISGPTPAGANLVAVWSQQLVELIGVDVQNFRVEWPTVGIIRPHDRPQCVRSYIRVAPHRVEDAPFDRRHVKASAPDRLPAMRAYRHRGEDFVERVVVRNHSNSLGSSRMW